MSAGILRTGTIENVNLDEVSGMQAAHLTAGVYFLHNDDGKPRIYAMNAKGSNLGSFTIKDAHNRDWEDMTIAPTKSGPLLIIADSGDNFARHKSVILYFVAEPVPDDSGRYSGQLKALHHIELQYPDGARDCESIAFDKTSDRIILLSKRDKPPHLYSISLQDALSNQDAILRFDGETASFRPPGTRDQRVYGKRKAQWVSQPTGLDFSPDGTLAAVITYRSLYLFRREEGEPWAAAFARKPTEFEGPSSRQEESVSFTLDGAAVMITSEGLPAPVYRFRLITEITP